LPIEPEFLDIDDVLELHALQIAEHGGSEGLRDRGLLDSAVAQPMARFGGQFLHRDVFEMAAALHISLVLNHAFVDGNKRTALLAAVTFLDMNRHAIEYPSETLFEITHKVAAGSATKEQVAAVFRDLAARSITARKSRWRQWLDSFVRIFRLRR